MKKSYWVMRTPGSTAEWIELNGKQFYELITSTAGNGRYFMDWGDYKIEVLPEQYRKWKSEARRHQYLQERESEVLVLSLDSLAVYNGISRDELAVDLSVNIEEEAIHNIDLQRLSEAILTLTDDEQWLITEMFMRDKPKTERELTLLTGIPNQTIHYRKNKILKKLKKYLGKSKKNGQ